MTENNYISFQFAQYHWEYILNIEKKSKFMQITRESFENNLKYSEQYYINKTF